MEENTTPQSPHFSTGKREFWLLIAIAVCSVLIVDFALYGGLNLGFAIMAVLISVLSTVYLRKKRPGPYCICLFILNLIIAASFLRSDDCLVKFVMLCFLMLSGNLHLSLLSGQNRRKSSGITSLLDAPRAFFALGFGQLGNSMGGLNDARKNGGAAVKNNVAILIGLAIAVPVLAILIPLLMKADAAFEGLLNLLPRFDITEAIIALMFGLPLACILYTRNTALKHKPKEAAAPCSLKQFNQLTVNTVLVMVCLLYLAYLISQLAYFVGGFSGILPEEYTMAQYARRGFFEMAWLAAINLGIMTICVGLTEKKDGRAPVLTRLLCLFIGIITLFFTVAASAKMLLYIDSYGLTRLRLLTEVIMIFIALTVIFVTIWLFRPKFAYMKAVLLTALLMGSCVAWADVDTVVAAYNVNAYQTGRLATVDVSHLSTLGDGAVPYIEKLTHAENITLRATAKAALQHRSGRSMEDLRSWNIATSQAEKILEKYEQAESPDPASKKLKSLAYFNDNRELAVNLLYPYLSEYGENGPVRKLYLKDASLWLEDGTHLEPVCSYDVMWNMQDAGVGSIWVCDRYVLFRPAVTDAYCLMWTQDSEKAMESLWDDHPACDVEHLIDEWYFLNLIS